MAHKALRILHALGVPIRRLGAVELVASETPGIDYTQSTFTQQSGRGGLLVDQTDPPSDARWVLSGQQTETVQLVPVPYFYSADVVLAEWHTWDENAGTYGRGQITYSSATAYTVGRVSTGATVYARKHLATVPTTEKISLISAISTDADTRIFDPATWSWESEDNLGEVGSTGHQPSWVCNAAIDDRRIVYVSGQVVPATNDTAIYVWHGIDGDNPDLAATALVRDNLFGTGHDRATAIYHPPTGAILVVACDVATGNLGQLVSRDLGVTWNVVGEAAAVGTSPQLAVAPNGDILLCYSKFSNQRPHCRRLALPWSDIEDIAEVEIASGAASHVAAAVESGTGAFLCVYSLDATNTRLRVQRSTDRGATWSLVGDPAWATNDANNTLSDISACYAQSRLWVAMNIVRTPGTQSASVVLVAIAGQASCDGWPIPTGISYYPLDVPSWMGWTSAGTAPTISTTTGELDIATAAATSTHEQTLAFTKAETWSHWTTRLSVGGSVAADDVSVEVRCVDTAATDEARLLIRFSLTGFRTRDVVAGTTLETLAFDMTVPTEWVCHLQKTGGQYVARLWYRKAGKARFEFAQQYNLTANAAGAATTHRARFGHYAATTSTSHGWTFQLAEDETALEGIPVGSFPTPLVNAADPLDAAYEATAGLCYLTLERGPASLVSEWKARPAYDYGLAKALHAPSPSRGEWRSVSEGEQLMVWDLVDEEHLGTPIGLLVQGANFRTALLQYYDGAAWQTLGTLDLAYGTALSYDLGSGLTAVPQATGNTASRSVRRHDLRGGTLKNATSGQAGRILGNTAGTWGPSSVAVRPTLRLATAITATGTTGEIWHPDGVLVVHPPADVQARYWRIRIPAGQGTVEGYYRAKVITPVAFVVLGESADDGTTRTRSSGISDGRALVRPLRSVTMSFTAGMDLTGVRAGTADYVGAAAGPAGASYGDVEGQLAGVLEELSRDEGSDDLSPELCSVVALLAMPTSTGTVTDPTLFVYGEPSLSVTATQSSGVEGASEWVRVDAISVTERP